LSVYSVGKERLNNIKEEVVKRYALIIVMVFIGTSVYAADLPGGLFNRQAKKPVAEKDVKKDTVVKEAPKAVNPKAAPQAASQAVPQTAPPKKLTREEMISRINEMLKARPNIVANIQGLQEEKAGGFTYNGKKIEDLDEGTLMKLLAMINQQISIDNLQKFDRQQRQLKNLQQIEQINRTQRALKEQQMLTRSATPKIYTPPKIPKIPKTRY
jgi:hypothetical protein